MKIIELNKRLYTIPETWNELTGRQLVAVIKVLYGNEDVNVAQLKLLKILTGMGWYRFFKVPLEDKMDMLYLTHFLVNERGLTKNLLPQYKGFAGPDDDFNNITGEEFVFSEEYYFQCYGEDKQINVGMLNELVAILYRKKKKDYNEKINKDGDARDPFNQNVCTYHAKRSIRKWPLEVKLAIFNWYETCRQVMIDSNPEIFSGGSNEQSKYGLLSVMRVIAEGGIHGTFEQVQKMQVKMWMMELNEKHEEAKRGNKK